MTWATFIRAAAAGLVLFAAPAGARSQLERLLALTPDDYAATASVKDDALETTATVTTLNGFQEKQGLLGVVWDDVFLRGFVDKQSGAATYQVYAVLYWSGSGWPFFNQANVALPDGTRSVEVSRVGSDVDCSASRYGGCTFTEQVVFELGEDQVRRAAATYVPGARNGIAMRFKGQGGVDQDMVIMPAEFAGFLRVMDRLRASYPGHPGAARTPAPGAPIPARPGPSIPATPSPDVSPTPLATPAPQPVPQASGPAVGNSHVQCVTCSR